MCRAAMLILAAATIAGSPTGAWAQSRCDCTTIVGSCTAEIAPRESGFEVTTNSLQCARVDYFVDGLPFVTTVVGGQSRLDRSSPRSNPDIRVQSCQICVDRENGADAAATSEAAGEEGPLEPLIRWAAEYPPQAQRDGREGYVTVEFDVTPEGSVDNAEVVESEPAELFDRAALEAVRRWRYAPDERRAATRLTERIDFSLSDMIWRLQPSASPAADGAAVSMPRNQCVHEDAVYNFGEMVEVGLINACEEPLLVYGCAEGTGRDTGRWVCSDSERLETLLVRPGDPRAGTAIQQGEQAGTIRWLTYGEAFFLARAPNTQYWWIACRQVDAGCRENGRMWIRSMDRQPASVDPRGRSSVTVARSY
jgi:TonB family protein